MIEFVHLTADDYDRGKKILNAARHPGFVGRELFYRCATTGRCIVATIDGVDCGVLLVAKEKVQALSVIAKAQGKGVGAALLDHAKPRWANVIGERVAWFERRGYRSVGASKVGQNGKHSTQLMERSEEFVGNTPESRADVAGPQKMEAPPQDEEQQSLFALVASGVDLSPTQEAEMGLLNTLFLQAMSAQKFDSATKIIEKAKRIAHFANMNKT